MAAEEPALVITRPSPKRLILALTALLVLAVACGGSGDADDETPSPSPTSSASPSPTTSASPTPTPLSLGAPTFDANLAAGHVNTLAIQIGIRSAGSPNEKRGAEYIRDELASYGYEAAMQPFSIGGAATQVATLSIAGGGSGGYIPAVALTGSANGAAAGIVVAGLGYPQEFPSNTTGRIALVQRGEIFFSEKVANAQRAGASAVIIYNNEPGGFTGELDAATIPAVSVAQEDGAALASTVRTGATALLSVESADTESHNVVAKPPGGVCRVIVGGHLDSVPAGPGANDNGSGTAVGIEMARAMAADGVLSDVCFAFFGAEEIGLLGSFHYVSVEDLSATEAMLNFDMLGVGERWPLGGSTELVNVAAEVAEANGIPYTIEGLPEGLGSDHAPFIQAGVPALIVNCFCDPNYHTAQDLAEFVKTERLGQAGTLGMGMVERLLGG